MTVFLFQIDAKKCGILVENVHQIFQQERTRTEYDDGFLFLYYEGDRKPSDVGNEIAHMICDSTPEEIPVRKFDMLQHMECERIGNDNNGS